MCLGKLNLICKHNFELLNFFFSINFNNTYLKVNILRIHSFLSVHDFNQLLICKHLNLHLLSYSLILLLFILFKLRYKMSIEKTYFMDQTNKKESFFVYLIITMRKKTENSSTLLWDGYQQLCFKNHLLNWINHDSFILLFDTQQQHKKKRRILIYLKWIFNWNYF